MKKVLKISLISLLSLIVLLIISLSTVVVLVFNSNLLVNVVNKKAADFITCDYHIGRIEPCFFKTFPQFSLQIEDVYLQDKLAESQQDTLLYVGNLQATVDVKRLLKDKELIVKEVLLHRLSANVFVSEQGEANYDIFALSSDTIDEEQDTTAFSMPFSIMALDKIEINDLDVKYKDCQSAIFASLSDLDLAAKLAYGDNRLFCQLNSGSPALSFAMNDTLLLDHQPIALSLPLDIDLSAMQLHTQDLSVALGKIALLLHGNVAIDTSNQDILTDLSIQLGGPQEPISHYLQLVPAAYQSLLDGIEVDGLLGLSAKVQGTYNQTSMPLVDVLLQVDNTSFSYPDLPRVEDIKANISAHLNLNELSESSAHLEHLSLRANKSSVQASAQVNHLLTDDMKLKAKASVKADLAAWQDFLPDSIDVNGRVQANADVALKLKDLENLNNLKKIKLNADVAYQGLAVAMGDLQAQSSKGKVRVDLRQKAALPIYLELNDIQSLQVAMADTIQANIQDLDFQAQLSDVLADMEHIKAQMAMNFGKAQMAMADQIQAQAQGFHVEAAADLQGQQYDKMKVDVKLSNQSILAQVSEHKIQTQAITLDASLKQDSLHENILHRFNPQLSMYLQSATVNTSILPEEIQVADIQFSYADDNLKIQQSSVNLGNSDFHLDGHLSNIIAFLEDESLLKAELNFVSNHTDVNRLMELTSGLGVDSTEMEIEEAEMETLVNEEDSLQAEPNPFIVPKGVDVLLHTDIKEAVVGKQLATKLSGNLYIRDGVMILEEIGFVCDAAKLQLTAMYRSPRPNHLYVGLDYHMVDIQIDELLEMVPQVDSILPMLRSFRGGAEFHIAAETYLNARYELKKSTLRGACSIQGQDLVLLDGENFSEIAKILRFNKNTENVIDTLNAEITVFRNEVDIYPIQLSIDKYKAIVAGRHNLDMSFNYHASLVSPLRLGVDVSGTFDDLKIRPVQCRYTDQFRPAERRVLEQQQLSLRKIIQESLIKDL